MKLSAALVHLFLLENVRVGFSMMDPLLMEGGLLDKHWFASENEVFGLKQMGSLSLPPTVAATDPPTIQPTVAATDPPTIQPTYLTELPTVTATDPPTFIPTFLTDPPTVTATDSPTATLTKSPTKSPTSSPTAPFCENIGANSETEYNARLEEIYEEVSFEGAFDGTDVDRLNALRFIRDEQFCADPPRLIQRYVAALFFYATVGADWTITKGWLGPAHECDWFKLECNDDLQITRIGVDENGLAGTIAPELCALPKLRSIDLDDNKITGTIPEIDACRSLQVLDLDNNQLTGSLPDSLYTIPGMTSIDVDTNSLTGVLNPKIGDLINLEYLAINGNAFSGRIPQELQSLQQLKIAYLDENEFTGAVAPGICKLTTDFELVEITTDCSGDAPKVQCSCCLNCSESGSESELRLRRIIEEMAVTISGEPALVQGTPQQRAVAWLQDDAVKNRREDVTSPCALRQRYAATVLYFSFGGDKWVHQENYLTDADECEWNDQVTVTTRNGSSIKTVGLFCDAKIEDGTCVTRIMLGDNELAGGFPEEITSLNNLVLIDMDENAITGTIPPSIGNRLPNLRVFDLDNNQLTGTLPSSLFKVQMKIVDVDTNLLQGPLRGLDNAPNLEYLSVFGNQMTGPLPSAAFAQMKKLETLYLDNNQFTGSLDQKVCDLTDRSLGTFPPGSLRNLMVDCSITRPSEDCGDCN